MGKESSSRNRPAYRQMEFEGDQVAGQLGTIHVF